jgi:hypothetical protein
MLEQIGVNGMKKLLAMVISLTLINSYVSAEGFNYDYIVANAGTTSSTAIDRNLGIGLSKSIHSNVALRANVNHRQGKWVANGSIREQTGIRLELESIYHRDIGANTDILVTLGYSYEDTKTTNISSYKLEAHAASLGIRQSLTDTIEGEIQYALMNSESNSSIQQVYTNLMFKISNNMSIGAKYMRNITGADFNQTGIIIRRKF